MLDTHTTITAHFAERQESIRGTPLAKRHAATCGSCCLMLREGLGLSVMVCEYYPVLTFAISFAFRYLLSYNWA